MFANYAGAGRINSDLAILIGDYDFVQKILKQPSAIVNRKVSME